MSLTLRRADGFVSDFDLQYRWYASQSGDVLARRYLEAVWRTLEELTERPGMGRRRRFRHPLLKGLHSFRVRPPFEVHLIFYRFSKKELSAERLMSGRRDLSRRLREPPEQ